MYIGRMLLNALKLVVSGALILVTAGAWPNPRYGAIIAVGVCIMGAVVLHFAAP
jgi:hypothetical protein